MMDPDDNPIDPLPPDDSHQVNIDFCEFLDRLYSFMHYLGGGDVEDLAKAGWRSYKNSDIIYCDNCDARGKNVDECDNVLLLHFLLSPDCKYFENLKLKRRETLSVDENELLSRCKFE